MFASQVRRDFLSTIRGFLDERVSQKVKRANGFAGAANQSTLRILNHSLRTLLRHERKSKVPSLLLQCSDTAQKVGPPGMLPCTAAMRRALVFHAFRNLKVLSAIRGLLELRWL